MQDYSTHLMKTSFVLLILSTLRQNPEELKIEERKKQRISKYNPFPLQIQKLRGAMLKMEFAIHVLHWPGLYKSP